MSRIDDLYTTARRAFERGDAAQWEAAEAMAELVDRGETHRQIAGRLGCSHSTVSRYVAVVRGSSGTTNRGSFTEILRELRTDNLGRETIPKAPEQRAALVADLLKDKAVADAPQVRKVQERHADRRARTAAADFNREHGIPTRTAADRQDRVVSSLENKIYWRNTLAEVQRATRALNEAATEVDRSGLPRAGSWEMIKAARALARAADRFVTAASEAGVGKAMGITAR